MVNVGAFLAIKGASQMRRGTAGIDARTGEAGDAPPQVHSPPCSTNPFHGGWLDGVRDHAAGSRSSFVIGALQRDAFQVGIFHIVRPAKSNLEATT